MIKKGPYIAYFIALALILSFASVLVVNTIKDDNVKTNKYSEIIDSVSDIDSTNIINS